MNKKINKINNLTIINSTLQINFERNFEYIDNAGKIINLFKKDDRVPEVEHIDVNTLLLSNISQNNERIKVSHSDVWIKFTDPSSLDLTKTSFLKYIKNIKEVFDIQKINRIGWRIGFVYDLKKDENLSVLNLMKEIGNIKNLRIENKDKDIKYTIQISELVKTKNPEDKAVLIDIDFYNNDKNLEVHFFNDIFTFIKTTEFLGIINKLIK